MRSRTSLPALCLVVAVAGLSTGGVGCGAEAPADEEDTLSTTHPVLGVEPDTTVLSAPASAASQAHGIHKWYVHYIGSDYRPKTGLTFFGVDASGNYVAHGSIAEAETNAGLALQFFDKYDGTLIVEPEAAAAASQIAIQRGTYGANVGAYGNATSDLAVNCGLRPSCDYTITWDVMTNNGIGDPAVGVPKQFVAEWLCPTGPRSVATVPGVEAIGQTIHLDCANPAVPGPVDPSGQLPLRAVVDTLTPKGNELFHLWANDMQSFAPGAPANPSACNQAKAGVAVAYGNMFFRCRGASGWIGLGACMTAAAGIVLARNVQKAMCAPAPADKCTNDSQCVAAHGPNYKCDVPSGTCVPSGLMPPPAGDRGTVLIAVTPPIYIPWPSPPGSGCNDEWDCFAGRSCFFGVCS
jgi:hypothetical protein